MSSKTSPEFNGSQAITQAAYVVDDDPHMRALLEHMVTAAGMEAELFASAEAFLERAAEPLAGCLILDVRMPGADGLDLYETLRDRGINLPTVLITAHADLAMAIRALRAGVHDFVEKPLQPEELLEAMERAVARNNTSPVDPALHPEIVERHRGLSPRERQVMGMIVDGMLNKQIAQALGLSMKTIEKHRGNVMRKMQADSLAELVRMAVAIGVA